MIGAQPVPAAKVESPEESKSNPKDLKHQAVLLADGYAKLQLNKMMMDAAGPGRFFHLEPEQHIAAVQGASLKSEFPTTIHIQF